MARVICFRDGSFETLLHEDDPVEVRRQLEWILRERLGDEITDLFYQAPEDYESPDDELKSYEMSCESYRDCLQDAHDVLGRVLEMLKEKRINRTQIATTIERVVKAINNEL